MELNQNTIINEEKTRNLVENQVTLHLKINLQLLNDDIDRLKKMIDKTKSPVMLKNIKMTIKYLEGIRKKANKSTISLDWTVINNKVVARPFEMRKIDMLDINTTDYVVLDDKTLVNIDYSDVINAIALELGHRDFCLDSSDIEKRLKDISIISVNDINILKERGILEDDMAVALMSSRIEDTPYRSDDTNERYDYFGNNVGEGTDYRDMIESSINCAMQKLVYNTFNTASQIGIDIYVCGVYENSMAFIMDNDKVEALKNKLENDKVTIRVFGRKFEVTPKIVAY